MFTWISILLMIPLPTLFLSCGEKQEPPEDKLIVEQNIIKETEELSIADTTRAGRYFAKAEQFTEETKHDSAAVYFEKARRLYEDEISQTGAERAWIKYIKCYNGTGESLRKRGEYDKAKKYFETGLELGLKKLGEHHLEVATSYSSLGNLDRIVGQHDKALHSLNKALDIQTRILDNKSLELATTYNRIGILHRVKGEHDQALDFYKKSLSIKREKLGDNDRTIAVMYNNIGNIYRDKGDFEEALKYYVQGKEMISDTSKKNQNLIAALHSNIGVTYFHKGDYEQALSFLKRSLGMRIKLSGKGSLAAANTYNSIGMVFHNSGDYDEGHGYFQKALKIIVEKVGEEHEAATAVYNNIANYYEAKGEYAKALILHHQILKTRRALFGENNFLVAWTFHNAGVVYGKQGDHKKELEYSIKALAIRKQVYGEIHPEIAWSYSNIGGSYTRIGEYEKALKFLQKGLSMRIDLLGEKHPEVAYTLRGIGDAYFRQQKIKKALEYFQMAIISLSADFNETDIYINPSSSVDVSSESYLVDFLADKARAFRELYNLKTKNVRDVRMALSTYELASKLIDRLRNNLESEKSKLFLSETAVSIYQDAVETALQIFYLDKNANSKASAFEFAEKSKGSVLLAALSESKAKQFSGVPDILLARERQLRVDRAYYEQSLITEQQKGIAAYTAKIVLLQDRIFELSRADQALLERFENEFPDYFNLKYKVNTVSIIDVQEQILNESTAMIEYFVGKDSIFIFTITPNEFDVTAVIKGSAFQKQVDRLRAGIIKRDFALYTESAYRLYQILLEPVADKLRFDNLVMVPDGLMNTIPFEALLTSAIGDESTKNYATLPYLLEKYAISYAYSATLLQELRAKRGKRPKHNYLAFAPVFRNGLPASSRGADLLQKSLMASTRSVIDIPPGYLSYSEMEVIGVFDLFQSNSGFWRSFGTKSKIFLEDDATEANAKSVGLADYRYVHFATHGFINEKEPKLSGLQLAENPNDSTLAEDGYLYLAEVYNLNLRADLVTLSACETGLGQVAKGEGLIGLTRGFLYAGASNVLVSLWKVDDRATADFMVDFYSKILEGTTKTEALREAKRAMISLRHPEYNKPYYWAPFILIGR